MKTLPEGWRFKGITHGLRILKALVEQGERIMKGVSKGPWKVGHFRSPRGARACSGVGNKDGTLQICQANSGSLDMNLIAASRSLVPALVEGAKAVLKTFEEYDTEPNREVWLCACQFVESQAVAYVPKMIEVGMTVPE